MPFTVEQINKQRYYYLRERRYELSLDDFIVDFKDIKEIDWDIYLRQITPQGRMIQHIVGNNAEGCTDEGYFLVIMHPADYYPSNVDKWKKKKRHIRTYKSGKVVEIHGDKVQVQWSHFEI